MDGLILVDKPQGVSSHDVVVRLRRILKQQRIGHFGTLDPLATGLLLAAAGRAARLFPVYSKADKSYAGAIRLGFSTDTYDALGKPTSPETTRFPDRGSLAGAIKELIGRLDQVPPPYSAKKLRGKPLYKWARAQKTAMVKPVAVSVYSFDLTDYAPPFLSFEVRCSSGTYIRSLAHELGRSLSCGAHLFSLRRTTVGRHSLADSHSLTEIARLAYEGKPERFLVPLESLLPECPKAILSETGLRCLRKGKSLPPEHVVSLIRPADGGAAETFRLFSLEGRFLALAKPSPDETSLVPFLLLS
ncbi:MAG: tRNA pseudouridine(55) synthase TruB [Acidobacteriota bacterium]